MRSAGAFFVECDVTNTGQAERQMPRLRAALRGAAEAEIEVRTIDAPKDRLLPGEVAHFEHPSDEATGVVVTFSGNLPLSGTLPLGSGPQRSAASPSVQDPRRNSRS